MGFFSKDKEQTPEEEKQEAYQSYVETFKPAYNQPAKTNWAHIDVKEGSDEFTFRKLEPASVAGKWHVYEIKIYDTTKVLKKEFETFAGKDTSDKIKTSEKNIVVQIGTMSVKRNGEDTNELTYLEGMNLLAELERRAVSEAAGYSLADLETIQKTLNLADTKLVEQGLQTDELDNLEHFYEVCKREGIGFTIENEAYPIMKLGEGVTSLKYTGRILLDELARVKQASKDAKKGPLEGIDPKLSDAFFAVQPKNKIACRMLGLTAIDERDKFMKAKCDAITAYKALYEKPANFDLYDSLDNLISECEYMCDNAHKQTQSFVEDDKQLLNRMRVSAILLHSRGLENEMVKAVKEGSGRLSYNEDRINSLERAKNNVLYKMGYNESDIQQNGINIQDVTISIEYLETDIESYNKFKERVLDALDENPTLVASQSKVMGSKALQNKR